VPARPPGGRPRILLGPSQLGATSTAAGIRFFAREVVPRLDRALGRDGYDVHVIGKGDPPDELARMLPHPGIVVRGWVDDIDAELASATLQLAPTPFVLGKRMRIVSAWAYGLCVVAHAAEAVNLPELVDGETGLLGADGAGVADAIVRAARDSDLRERIGTNGRRVYESTFHPSVAARALVQRLEALTSGGVPARSSARGV
jgi:glycosyltransferase involved in cell wall biosynthesis